MSLLAQEAIISVEDAQEVLRSQALRTFSMKKQRYLKRNNERGKVNENFDNNQLVAKSGAVSTTNFNMEIEKLKEEVDLMG